MRMSVVLAASSAIGVMVAASAVYAADMAPAGYGARSGMTAWGPGTPAAEDYPPNAQPGQCFAKVLIPEQTETYTEQVLVSPEKVVTRVAPGQCGYEDKTVVVREPSSEFITVPATFRTVTETVVVKAGGFHTQTIPPTYRTVTEQILVRDGYTVWRPGSTVSGYSASGYGSNGYSAPPPGAYVGSGAEPNPAYGNLPTRVLATGEVLCLVQVPPEYKTITKQVLESPGRTLQAPYPAETAVVSRQVVDIPAHVEKRELPGETKIIKVKTCTPDQTTSATLPAEYKTVTKMRTISPSKFEWKPVDCKAEVAHAPYAPPTAIYGRPPVRRLPHHYRPRVRPPVRVFTPPKPMLAPPVAHKGKICHATCDDGTTRVFRPSSTPPVVVEQAPVYTRVSLETTSMVSASGNRAVIDLQTALAARGYYVGSTNGLFTQDTMAGMVKFQRDHRLAEGRYTGETANALGISR